MFYTEVDGTDIVIARLESLPERVVRRLQKYIGLRTRLLFDGVRDNVVSIFKPGTGRLFRSIKRDVQINATGATGKVYSDGSVPYAAIHEFGGLIDHPGSDEFQAFRGRDGRMVFTHYTRPHFIPIPERSYARSELALQAIGIIDGARAEISIEVDK